MDKTIQHALKVGANFAEVKDNLDDLSHNWLGEINDRITRTEQEDASKINRLEEDVNRRIAMYKEKMNKSIDANLEKANNFKDEFGVTKAFGNYDELLDDKDLDVIYVSTPHSNHYEYIKKALLKGKHVLCENDITVNSNELNEV